MSFETTKHVVTVMGFEGMIREATVYDGRTTIKILSYLDQWGVWYDMALIDDETKEVRSLCFQEELGEDDLKNLGELLAEAFQYCSFKEDA